MISVDLRTRTDDMIEPVDPTGFFGNDLPALIERHGRLAVPGAAELSPRPLAFTVGDRSWTLALDGDALVLSDGDEEAVASVVLDDEGLTDLVHDVRGAMGFFTGGELDMPRGRLEDFLDWSVILRSLIDGRAVHTTGAVDFRDQDGEPLDLHRSFSLGDDPAAAAHFLGEAGYLHIAGMFREDEMAEVSADMDRALPSYTPDDGRSWWATTADGD